jgi:hypothetical protein
MARTEYTPAYRLPDFHQSTPVHPDQLVLIEGNNKTGTLRYRDSTGQTYTVPNVPYNQQTPVRISYLRFMLNLAQQRDTSRFDHWTMRSHREYIERLESAIATLKAKGEYE